MAIIATLLDANFDSYFERAMPGQAAVLRIKIKVTLVPLDPKSQWAKHKHKASLPGAAATPLPPYKTAPSSIPALRGSVVEAGGNPILCETWSTSDWSAFQTRFKYIVEQAWNNQIILLPVELGGAGGVLDDQDFRQLIGNPKAPAHVKGVLEVDLQPIGASSHAVIEVAKLVDPYADFRNNMTRISDQSVQQSSAKFNQGAARNIGGSASQFQAAHEVGHWLRAPGQRLLDHIDRTFALTLPVAEQDDAQYGKTLSRFQSLMGAGSVVGPHEARPWINRLKNHTGLKLGWLYIHRAHFNWSPDDISAHQRSLISP